MLRRACPPHRTRGRWGLAERIPLRCGGYGGEIIHRVDYTIRHLVPYLRLVEVRGVATPTRWSAYTVPQFAYALLLIEMPRTVVGPQRLWFYSYGPTVVHVT